MYFPRQNCELAPLPQYRVTRTLLISLPFLAAAFAPTPK
uniref:Uncharacterized protein n=1 Tax=Arundo donax TaxID=35708 RepID=A0A0A9G0R4_ARUDO